MLTTANVSFPTSTTGTNEEGVPSQSYLQEVREQLEEREAELEEKSHQRETRSASDHTDGQSVRITELQLLGYQHLLYKPTEDKSGELCLL